MKPVSLAGRRLVFRSLLILFAGVVLVGVILDRLLFSLDQQDQQAQESAWLAPSFALLTQRLSEADIEAYDGILAEFNAEFSLRAALMSLQDIAMPEDVMQQLKDGEIVHLSGTDATAQYFRLLPNAAKLVSLSSPTTDQVDSRWSWISTLYYFAVFCLLALWLKPIVGDIERLNNVASRLGRDIHADTPELDQVQELNVLSATFAKMASRIKVMVGTQKDMTNALSHELRTPLARVKFGIAVLQDQVDDSVKIELDKINADINEFDALIARMLDYAKLDDPSVHFQAQLISASPWLTELCTKSRAEEQGIDCSLIIAPDAQELYADSELLGLAVSNLLSNALRYAKQRILITCHQSNSNWNLSIEDDGPGIPGHQSADVFKAFTRLDESRDRGTGGHGLGLAIVARITSLHGGRCQATRSQFGGALFTISLPLQTSA